MHQVTNSELQRDIEVALGIADKEPVFITREGGKGHVMLSIEEYRRLKRRDREVLSIEELSEHDLREIAAAEVPQGHGFLNKLLK